MRRSPAPAPCVIDLRSMVAVSVAVLAVLISAFQFWLSRANTQVGAEALKGFWSQEAHDLREVLWSLDGKPFEEWDSDEVQAMDRLATLHSLVGQALRHNPISRRAVLDFNSVWFWSAFEILVPMVDARRRELDPELDPLSGNREDGECSGGSRLVAGEEWIYFEWLAHRSYRHHERNRSWWTRRRFKRLKERTPQVGTGRSPTAHAIPW